MMLTGRFYGHFERDDRLIEEFDDLSAEEAIAWGRERAEVVLIRMGDSDYYSAGQSNPDPEEYEPWPPTDLRIERRRPSGFEALDNTEEDAPVWWDCRVSIESSVAEVDPRRLHTVVRECSSAREVQTPAPGYPRASAAFLVEAPTREQAEAIANSLVQAAYQATASNQSLGVISGCGFEVYPHREGEPVTGPGVTY